MSVDYTHRVTYRAAATLAVVSMLSWSPQGLAQAGESWSSDNCHYVLNSGKYVSSGYCRTFPIAGNGAVWDLYFPADPQRKPVTRLDISKPGWIYSYHYGTKRNFAIVNRGSIFFGDPRETFVLENSQWKPGGQAAKEVSEATKILYDLYVVNGVMAKELQNTPQRQATAPQLQPSTTYGSFGPAPGRRTRCSGRYIAYNVCENSSNNPATEEERHYWNQVNLNTVIGGMGPVVRSVCESNRSSEQKKYNDDLALFRQGKPTRDPRSSGYPNYSCQ